MELPLGIKWTKDVFLTPSRHRTQEEQLHINNKHTLRLYENAVCFNWISSTGVKSHVKCYCFSESQAHPCTLALLSDNLDQLEKRKKKSRNAKTVGFPKLAFTSLHKMPILTQIKKPTPTPQSAEEKKKPSSRMEIPQR